MNTTSFELRGATETVGRIRRGLRRHGVGGSLRLAWALLARLAYLEESHVWYLLDLRGDRPRVGLPSALEVVRATEDELPLLAELPTVGPREARQRLAAAADLWLVRDADRAVFACWTFPDRRRSPRRPGGSRSRPAWWAWRTRSRRRPTEGAESRRPRIRPSPTRWLATGSPPFSPRSSPRTRRSGARSRRPASVPSPQCGCAGSP